jgi:septum formation protein
MREIILASASPRRQELLARLGLACTVDPAANAEDTGNGGKPEEIVQAISRAKALAVAGRHPGALIIAADTIGLFRGHILGKPRDAADARRMLGVLSGHSHLVITGFTIMDAACGKTLARTVTTRVYFRRLTRPEIDCYVDTGEPLDKAGAYAIQGRGALLVEKIAGDYYNVMGLPLCALGEALRDFGINLLEIPG